LAITETVEDNLANSLWHKWKTQGTQTRLTWLEVQKLAGHLTKTCKEKELDYQEFDFSAILDSKLNYYENFSAIDEAIEGPARLTDKDYMAVISREAEMELQTLEAIEKERDKLLSKCTRLEQNLSQAKKDNFAISNTKTVYVAMPTPETHQQQPTTKEALLLPAPPIEAAIKPEDAPYTDEELTEIQNYLKTRITPETPKIPFSPETIESKLAHKTWRLIVKVLG
jgi:hypothetical protein